MESTKEYLKLFNVCPIKIGDTVRVLCHIPGILLD